MNDAPGRTTRMIRLRPCVGARDDEASNSLTAALETESLESVKSLRLATPPDHTAWCAGKEWWLSTAEVA